MSAGEEDAPRASKEAVAECRQRLAQTLHDTVCQSLTAVYLNARYLEKKLQNSGSNVAGEVFELGEMIHRVVEELHGIMSALRSGEETPPAKPESQPFRE